LHVWARLDPALLSPIHHRSPQAQADLAILRSLDALVRCRTLLINHVRGTAKAAGARLPSCTPHGFAAKVAATIPEALQLALLPVLDTVAAIDQQIRDYDRQIEALCHDRYPETLALRRVAGVGPLTALAFILTLEDPGRFRTSSRPSTCGSGQVCPSGKAERSIPLWAWSLSAISPATATLSFESPHRPGVLPGRPATTICAASWSAVPNTSSAPSAPIAICAAGVCASPNAEVRAPIRERSSQSLASWPSCSIACGLAGRSMSRPTCNRSSPKNPPPFRSPFDWT